MAAVPVPLRSLDAGDPCRINTDPDALVGVTSDASSFSGGFAGGLARPANEQELVAVLTAARESAFPILTVGSQSSLTGGAVPFGDLVIQTAGFDAISSVFFSGQEPRVRVGAGVELQRLLAVLNACGYYYPPTPTYQLATIGGTAATNAAGSATFKYGSTRGWVRGLRVLTVDGYVLDIHRGDFVAPAGGSFELKLPQGETRVVPVPRYGAPPVKKCSMGYPGGDTLDLVDLFIGSEGTLGIVTELELALVPQPVAVLTGLLFVPDEAQALRVAGLLRAESKKCWAGAGRIDVRAIEHMDGASLDLLRQRDVKLRVPFPPDARQLLYFEMELAQAPQGDEILQALEETMAGSPPPTSVGDLLGLLAGENLLDRLELALPGEPARAAAFREVREAVPLAVNETIRERQALLDPAIRKLAGDMCVPFERFPQMLASVRESLFLRGLQYVVFGHISDGNVHPNILARDADEMAAGKEALLEIGDQVRALGGTPLAEHGVGRNPLKQELMARYYGPGPIDEMRRIKDALDPEWRLARGVLLPVRKSGS